MAAMTATMLMSGGAQVWAQDAKPQEAKPANEVKLDPRLKMTDDEATSLVRYVLVTHPEILIEASKALREKTEKANAVSPQDIARVWNLITMDDGIVFGNPLATKTIVEFFDYNCPYCRASMPEVEKFMSDKKDVRLVLKQYPILGAPSVFAAKAELAAQMQKHGRDFHDAMMTGKGHLTEDEVKEVAKSVKGLDYAKFEKDVASKEISDKLNAFVAIGQAKLHITGTPTFVSQAGTLMGFGDSARFKEFYDKTVSAK